MRNGEPPGNSLAKKKPIKTLRRVPVIYRRLIHSSCLILHRFIGLRTQVCRSLARLAEKARKDGLDEGAEDNLSATGEIRH